MSTQSMLVGMGMGMALACHSDPSPRATPPQSGLAASGDATPSPARPAPPIPPPRASTLAPAPPDANACERSCGDLHGCLLVLGQTSSAAAARIEISCLEVCLAQTPREPRFACPRPARTPADALPLNCQRYTQCVRQAWTEPAPTPEPLPIIESGRGCEQACLAFGRCRDLPMDIGDRAAIDSCVEQCVEVLDAEQERRAGECSKLGICTQIERCILGLPGA